MAEGTKLVLTFQTSEGTNKTFNFNYAKTSGLTVSLVNALMTSMIANTEIFSSTLTGKIGAKTVTTSETTYDLSAAAVEENPNSLGMPLYEALKRGIITEEEADATLSDYDESGKLKDTSGPLPEKLQLHATA